MKIYVFKNAMFLENGYSVGCYVFLKKTFKIQCDVVCPNANSAEQINFRDWAAHKQMLNFQNNFPNRQVL